jgi:hypothetical protein
MTLGTYAKTIKVLQHTIIRDSVHDMANRVLTKT